MCPGPHVDIRQLLQLFSDCVYLWTLVRHLRSSKHNFDAAECKLNSKSRRSVGPNAWTMSSPGLYAVYVWKITNSLMQHSARILKWHRPSIIHRSLSFATAFQGFQALQPTQWASYRERCSDTVRSTTSQRRASR